MRLAVALLTPSRLMVAACLTRTFSSLSAWSSGVVMDLIPLATVAACVRTIGSGSDVIDVVRNWDASWFPLSASRAAVDMSRNLVLVDGLAAVSLWNADAVAALMSCWLLMSELSWVARRMSMAAVVGSLVFWSWVVIASLPCGLCVARAMNCRREALVVRSELVSSGAMIGTARSGLMDASSSRAASFDGSTWRGFEWLFDWVQSGSYW